jgi:hypothetical protein
MEYIVAAKNLAKMLIKNFVGKKTISNFAARNKNMIQKTI